MHWGCGLCGTCHYHDKPVGCPWIGKEKEFDGDWNKFGPYPEDES